MEHNSFDDQIFGDFGDSLTPLGPKPIQAHHISHNNHHHQPQHHQQSGNHSIHVMLGGGQDMCQTQTRLPECNTILPGSPSLREVYAPLDYGNCQKVSDYISINKLGCYSPTQKYDYKLDEYSPQQKLHSLDYHHQNGEQQQHHQHHPHMQIYGHSPLHNNSSTTSTGGCDSERGTPQGPIDSNGINGTVGVVSLQNGNNNGGGSKQKKDGGDIIIATTSVPTASSSAASTSASTSCSSSSNVNSSVVVDQSSMNSNGNKKNDKNKKVDANGVKKKKTR